MLGFQQPVVHYCLSGVNRFTLEKFHSTFLRGGKRFENVSRGVHPAGWPPDTETNADKFWSAQSFLNIPQAVVASVAAALFDFERTQWQIKLVVDDDDSLRRNLEILRERSNRPTGSVHVTRRHGENDGSRRNTARKTP